MNIDLVKAQVYTFLEEIGLQGEETLAEEMAVKIIKGKDAENVFTSYVKNGVIEFEEDESDLAQDQPDDEWECEYCGTFFNSSEEALRHEEVCEMNYDEESGCQEDNEFDQDDVFEDY
jgi:hypothetical protein